MSENDKDNERISFAALPLTSTLKGNVRVEVEELLERLSWVKAQIATFASQENDMVLELSRLQRETGLTGFRCGSLAFCSQEVKGRNSLDRLLLMENGVSAATIKESMKTGNPTMRNTFKVLEDE